MRKIAILPAAAAFLALASPAPAQETPKPANNPVAAKTPEGDRLKITFASAHRALEAHYPNDSQAHLKLYPITRYDGEIAKPREIFVLEMTGSGIADPVRLDADDAVSLDRLIAVFERFAAESEKSAKIGDTMKARKLAADAELSREETRLVELKAAAAPDDAAVAASGKRIADLKAGVAMADEIAEMPKISGDMGKAKLNLDRPEYDFIASFEPAKKLHTLSAGYSFRISSRDVKYYIDLLKRAQELKTRLLENEAKDRRVRAEIDAIFADNGK